MSEMLHIDWTRCDGRGLCTELLPHLLSRDDWGYPVSRQVRNADPTNVGIGPGDVQAAREAIALCPKQALRLKSAK